MSRSIFDLTGDVAVVLGGTGVLGGGMASALAAAGASVAVVGRSAERGQERVRQIEAAGGRALDRKSTRLNSSHIPLSRMPSSA